MVRRSADDKAVIAVLAIWGIGVLVTLAFWVAVIWGIVKLVQHFTG